MFVLIPLVLGQVLHDGRNMSWYAPNSEHLINRLFPTPLVLCDAPGLPPRSTAEAPRHAIAGLADGYNVKALVPLVESVRQVMSPQTTDLVLLTNKGSDGEFKDFATKHSLTIVPFLRAPAELKTNHGPLLAHLVVFRFRYYEAIARTQCHQGLLLVDMRDIFFQRNVFTEAPSSWWVNSIVVTLEGIRKYSANGGVAMETHNLLANPEHQLHMNMLKCMLSSKALATLRTNETMACSGVLGGGGPALRHFLGQYNALAVALFSNLPVSPAFAWHRKHAAVAEVPKCQLWIPDQMLLNYMTYNNLHAPRGLVLSRNEDGPIFHERKELIRKHCDVPPTVMNEDRTRVAAVVHHIDRSPDLMAYWHPVMNGHKQLDWSRGGGGGGGTRGCQGNVPMPSGRAGGSAARHPAYSQHLVNLRGRG